MLHEIERMLLEIQKSLPPGLSQRLSDVETRLRARKWASLPGVDSDKFSFLRSFQAIRTGNWENAGYEKEVFENTRRKAMGTADDSAGGYLVPAEAMTELIEMLMADSVVIASGARVIGDLTGSPVVFPKQTGGATVYWVGDNDTITPSDLSTGQIKMTPHKAAALVQLSNSLLALSSPSAEAVVRGDLAAQLALAVDLAALRGPGTENQPLGIANTAGINTVTWSGAGLGNSMDLFEDLAYELAKDNALKGQLGFVFHPAIRRVLRKAKVPQYSGDPAGYPLVPAMILASMKGDGALQEALGYPFRTTTQLPVNLVSGMVTDCTEVYFGNWAELLIGQWGGLSILASNVAGTAFATDQTWIRVILNVDTAIRHAESFCLCNDVSIS